MQFMQFAFQIESRKLDFKDKAQSKVGSKDNMEHKAGGGDKKVTPYLLYDVTSVVLWWY